MNVWTAGLLLGIGLGMGVERLAAQNVADADSVGASGIAKPIATNTRLAETLPASYTEPSCFSGIDQRHVSRAMEAFKSALESKTIPERTPRLKEAHAALIEAITKEKQHENAGAWYSLAQVYLYQDNVAGADSALARASSMAPGCRDIVADLRYMAWVPLMNGGIELSKSDAKDSALILFRKAARIEPSKPHAAMNAGVLFANTGRTDSAIVYFRRAAELADSAKMEEDRNRATYNVAAMLQQSSRHAEAVEALEKYVEWVPDDNEAKNALATSYRAAGQEEKARELEKVLLAVIAASDTGAKRDSAVSGPSPLAAAVAMRAGINFYNEKKYADAAGAFEKVLEAEPHNRDAVYNLANAYIALKNGTKLVEIGTRLMQIEPMSESAYHLLGSGYKFINNIDEAIKIAEKLLALPADVVVQEFITRRDGAKLKMKAIGRDAQTAAGKSIKPAAAMLAFEFLDTQGGIVATKDAELPGLKPEEAYELAVEVKGKGIAAWRYSRK